MSLLQHRENEFALKKKLKGYFSLKVCIIWVVQKSMTMDTDMNVTKEDLKWESKFLWL